MNPTGMLLPTTVVGSYPVTMGRKGLSSLLDPLKPAVETAVADQIAAGIDIIRDGQVRGDMIQTFTSRLPGIRGQDVIGTVHPAAKPITLGDTKYALSRHPKVKGIITGPSTLAHGLRIETPAYRNREELVLDLAQALAPEAKALEAAGALILQIDEPILSTGAADLAVGRQAVALVASQLHVPVCLHVCGDLSAVIDEILQMPVAIFDFEFSQNPENREILSKIDLKGRSVGYGCVNSADPAVESVDTIRKRIEEGIAIFSPDSILIDPDCGMRMRTRDAAFAKLSNMVAATREVRKNL